MSVFQNNKISIQRKENGDYAIVNNNINYDNANSFTIPIYVGDKYIKFIKPNFQVALRNIFLINLTIHAVVSNIDTEFPRPTPWIANHVLRLTGRTWVDGKYR